MNLNIPAIDLEAEAQGKWFTYRGDIRLKLARIGNDAYMAGAATMYEQMEEDPEDVSKEDQEAMMATLYSRYILMDWSGVADKDTKEAVGYTPEQGAGVLGNPAYKDLLSFVLRKSRAINEYWEEETAATSKK